MNKRYMPQRHRRQRQTQLTNARLKSYIDDRVRYMHRTLQEFGQNLAALQALDVNFHTTGHIVIVSHVGNDPRCQIIPIVKHMTLDAYTGLVDDIARTYGVTRLHIDAQPGLHRRIELMSRR